MSSSVLQQYAKQLNTWHFYWENYWSICGLLHRQRDLEQLIHWATRKRLSKPRRLYQRLLIDDQQRLFHYKIRFPITTAIAHIAVYANNLINPNALSQYKRGYAQKYSSFAFKR